MAQFMREWTACEGGSFLQDYLSDHLLGCPAWALLRAPQKAPLFLLSTEARCWRRIALMRCCTFLLREQALLNTVTQLPLCHFFLSPFWECFTVRHARRVFLHEWRGCPNSGASCPDLSGLEGFLSTASLGLQLLAPIGLSVSWRGPPGSWLSPASNLDGITSHMACWALAIVCTHTRLSVAQFGTEQNSSTEGNIELDFQGLLSVSVVLWFTFSLSVAHTLKSKRKQVAGSSTALWGPDCEP